MHVASLHDVCPFVSFRDKRFFFLTARMNAWENAAMLKLRTALARGLLTQKHLVLLSRSRFRVLSI